MTEPRNERIPDELEPEVEDGRDEADQSDGLEMDSSWESMLDKRFADMADEQVVGLAQQGDSVAVEYLLSSTRTSCAPRRAVTSSSERTMRTSCRKA